tara:strand:+ start:3474 stop:4772 length:1299 start_codon:yes stop_codon:yes gene_type:complete
MESLKIQFEGSPPSLKSGETSLSRIKVPRHGDLLSTVNLVMKMPNVYSNGNLRFRWIENFATIFIRRADVFIGSYGRPIDTIYGDWMLIWNELTMSSGRKEGYNRMTGNVPSMTNPRITKPTVILGKNGTYQYSYYPSSIMPNASSLITSLEVPQLPSISSKEIAVPLQFYFSRDTTASIPLCALQTSELIIVIESEDAEKLYQVYDNEYGYISPTYYNKLRGTNIKITDFIDTNDLSSYMECKYVYLDEDERRMITTNQMNNQFIVPTIYRKDFNVIDNVVSVDLDLSTPVRELIWVMARADRDDRNAYTNYTASLLGERDLEILKSAKILWNKSNERVEEKNGVYFNKIQPYEHHTTVPKEGIYAYSFAVKPERWQPSGYYNPSSTYGINTSLKISVNKYEDIKEYTGVVFALIYNVLEIIGGDAGLKFA